MVKKAIITGDDFGLIPSVNRAIIKAYSQGILTSTSLMVNMPGFEDALDLIKGNPGLDVGLHINFLRGRPVLPVKKVRTLTDENGFFISNIFKIITGLYRKSIDIKHLELECDAQIRKGLENGVRITHLNSERHMHLTGIVYGIIVKLANRHGISWIRNINESPYLPSFISSPGVILNPGLYKIKILQYLTRRVKRINAEKSKKTTDYTFGLFATGRMTYEIYARLFNCLNNGTTEIISHPTGIVEDFEKELLLQERYDFIPPSQSELVSLSDHRLKDIIQANNIKLVDYSNA
ncbi:MAG: ChbG/HpnK family deacetylase [Candidatus Omnitrophota bacterium]